MAEVDIVDIGLHGIRETMHAAAHNGPEVLFRSAELFIDGIGSEIKEKREEDTWIPAMDAVGHAMLDIAFKKLSFDQQEELFYLYIGEYSNHFPNRYEHIRNPDSDSVIGTRLRNWKEYIVRKVVSTLPETSGGVVEQAATFYASLTQSDFFTRRCHEELASAILNSKLDHLHLFIEKLGEDEKESVMLIRRCVTKLKKEGMDVKAQRWARETLNRYQHIIRMHDSSIVH